MFDLIKDIIMSPAGSFGSVFALFALAFWLVHWITKKVTSIENSHVNLKDSNDNTNKKIDSLCEKQDKNMEEIRRDIAFLKAMADIFKSNPTQQIAQSHSPISLTEYGNAIAMELAADISIERNWEKIKANLEENVSDKNAYDIQQYCIETAIVDLSVFLDRNAIGAIKQKAYNEGKPLAYYSPIYGIKIRDRYLKEKGISSEEIDLNDPKRTDQ